MTRFRTWSIKCTKDFARDPSHHSHVTIYSLAEWNNCRHHRVLYIWSACSKHTVFTRKCQWVMNWLRYHFSINFTISCIFSNILEQSLSFTSLPISLYHFSLIFIYVCLSVYGYVFVCTHNFVLDVLISILEILQIYFSSEHYFFAVLILFVNFKNFIIWDLFLKCFNSIYLN